MHCNLQLFCITEDPSIAPLPTLMLNVSVEHSDSQPIAGERYTLTCVYSRNAEPSFQWLMNGRVLSGEMSNELNLHPLNVTDSGVYACEVRVDSTTIRSPVPYCLVVEGKTTARV